MDPRDQRGRRQSPPSAHRGPDDARFRLLAESVTDYAIFLLEPDGTVASWNPGAQRIKQYAAEEIIGKHFSVFYPEEDRKAKKPERMLRVAAAEGRVEDEGWRVRKDGTLFWGDVVITALRNPSGELVGYAKVTRDLTDRRRTEELLRRSEERLRLLVESVKDYAIFMLDAQGHVQSWNAGAQRIKQYTSDEIIGRHFSIFYPEEDIRAGKPAHELKVAAAKGRFEDEGWRLRKDGSKFWANVVISAMRTPAGELIGFSKVTRDLTERKEREEELRVALEELRRSNVELDEYASFVSHDLQEPLRKMASFAELLERRYKDKLEGGGQQYVHYIVDGARRMRALITDVLEYARLGRAKPDMGRVELDELVGEVLVDLEVAIKEAGAKVSVEPLPAVLGNAQLLARVFLNLLSNAVKYRDPERPIEVRVRADLREKECVIVVSDSGIGFPQEAAEQILRPFKRLHPKEKYPGTGLGLATVRKIVETHGGRLWAVSEPGRGSQFFVALRCA